MEIPEWLSPRPSFEFASPDLEQSFQGYLAQPPKWWSLLDMVFILFGYCNFAATYLSVPTGLRALLSPGWAGCLLQPIAAMIMIGLPLYPSLYTQHRVAVCTFARALLILGNTRARAHLLWRDFVREPAPERTLSQSMRAFSVENMYLSVAWFSILIADPGGIIGMFMNTLWMFIEVASNRYVCGLSYTGSNLASMSPHVLHVVLPVLQWAQAVAEPHIGAQVRLESVSCPVALGFWQVVGWWLSCHCIIAVDILRRRAFLRTPPALQLLAPDHIAPAMKWPFGNGFKALQLVLMSIVITQLCIIWLVFLPDFA